MASTSFAVSQPSPVNPGPPISGGTVGSPAAGSKVHGQLGIVRSMAGGAAVLWAAGVPFSEPSWPPSFFCPPHPEMAMAASPRATMPRTPEEMRIAPWDLGWGRRSEPQGFMSENSDLRAGGFYPAPAREGEGRGRSAFDGVG
jgi:hypothetical protein